MKKTTKRFVMNIFLGGQEEDTLGAARLCASVREERKGERELVASLTAGRFIAFLFLRVVWIRYL